MALVCLFEDNLTTVDPIFVKFSTQVVHSNTIIMFENELYRSRDCKDIGSRVQFVEDYWLIPLHFLSSKMSEIGLKGATWVPRSQFAANCYNNL